MDALPALAVGLVVAVAAVWFLVRRFTRVVSHVEALVVTKVGARGRTKRVCFRRALVLPLLHRAEVMDLRAKSLHYQWRELRTRDDYLVDIEMEWFVQVRKTPEDVLQIAHQLGVREAAEQSRLRELFAAKFREATRSRMRELDLVEVYGAREEFRDSVLQRTGTDLLGYALEDIAIDYLELTPGQGLGANERQSQS